MKKIKLEIFGISYSNSQSGAYALVLGETEGSRRLPIIIGNLEAQSIALELEKYKANRPLTHDLFFNFAQEFGIQVIEVYINKFSEGIFYSLLICKHGKETKEIDSRTSDAIALALRFGAPVYTNEEIMSAAGIILDDAESANEDAKNIEDHTEDPEQEKPRKKMKKTSPNFNDIETEELQKMLHSSIETEDFEKASLIRDELKRRNS